MPSLLFKLRQGDNLLKTTLYFFSLFLMSIAFYFDSPQEVIKGFQIIANHSDKLLTDYVAITNWGTTFFNAGSLMLLSVIMLHIQKISINGIAIASVFLMGGFGMFGKNIFNIWSILFGVYLYSCFTKRKFSGYIFIAFFGTALAPVVTEVTYYWGNSFYGLGFGIFIGFILPTVATYSLQVHMGYNLYNVGFAAGLIGTILVSILRSFEYDAVTAFYWYDKHKLEVIVMLYFLFILFMIFARIAEKDIFIKYKHLLSHSGRLVADFTILDGAPAVLFNMGLLGVVYTSYVLLVGGVLNGPTIGGIFSIVGFAGFGKHIKNTLPIIVGVILGTLIKVWNINDPTVLLAALFATGLAPIAGQFGPIAGIIAGFIHLSLVQVTGILHGGVNLYNGGFSTGIVALFLVPIIEMFIEEKERREENEAYEEETIENNG